jgi:virginiamycin B lyase
MNRITEVVSAHAPVPVVPLGRMVRISACLLGGVIAGALMSASAEAAGLPDPLIDPAHPFGFTNVAAPPPVPTNPLGRPTPTTVGSEKSCFAYDPATGMAGANGWYAIGFATSEMGALNTLAPGDYSTWSSGLTPARNTLAKVDGFIGHTSSGKQYVCTTAAMNPWYQAIYDVTGLAPKPALDGPSGGVVPGPYATSDLATPQITEHGPMPTAVAGVCETDLIGRHLWIEEYRAGSIARLDLRTQEIVEFPTPTAASVPGGMEVGPDGHLWFPEVSGNKIARLDPRDGSIEEFTIPWTSTPVVGEYGYGLVDDITVGADGAMWFALNGLNALGRIDVKTKEMSKYDIPSPPGRVDALFRIVKPGPGNTIVFDETAANKIGTINVFSKEFREYPLPTPGSLPQGVTTGPDGAIWFTESAGQNVGRIDPVSGAVQEFSILELRKNGPLTLGAGNPLPNPGPIVTGADGNLYFTENPGGHPAGGNIIARLDPRTMELREFKTPSPISSPCDLNPQDPHAIWFGMPAANKVGRLPLGMN